MTSWRPVDDSIRITPGPGFRLCYECHGARVCPVCGGEGEYDGKRCGNCVGKRACPICHGAGQLLDESPAPPPSSPAPPSFRRAPPPPRRKGGA